ncbi:zinc-binding dehydrogenase, partial [Liquorilactobacillus uvarum]
TWWLQPNGEELSRLGELVARGIVRVVVDSVFDLTTSGLQEAHQRSESHHVQGKIIIKA